MPDCSSFVSSFFLLNASISLETFWVRDKLPYLQYSFWNHLHMARTSKWHLLPVSNVTTSHPLHIGCCLVTGSCPTLCDPMDYSPPDSYIHGIFKARLLKWVDISSSRGSSRHRDQTHISCLRWDTGKAVPAALHFLSTSRLWLLISGDVEHLESLNLFEFPPSLLGFTVQR